MVASNWSPGNHPTSIAGEQPCGGLLGLELHAAAADEGGAQVLAEKTFLALKEKRNSGANNMVFDGFWTFDFYSKF